MHAESVIEPPNGATNGSPQSSFLSIQGMTCVNCVRHVTEAIQSVPGVQLVLRKRRFLGKGLGL